MPHSKLRFYGSIVPFTTFDLLKSSMPKVFANMNSSKTASEYYDPCQDFADRSLKCMKRNGFDREMCGDYFQYVYLAYSRYFPRFRDHDTQALLALSFFWSNPLPGSLRRTLLTWNSLKGLSGL